MRQPLRRARLTASAVVIGGLLAAPVQAQFSLGRVTGVVRDDVGVPIRGAIVTAENPSAAPSSFTTTTDEKGEFALLGMSRGLWTFTVKAPGFEPTEFSLGVRPRTTIPPARIFLKPSRAPAPRSPLAAVDVEALQATLDAAEAAADEGRIDEALGLYREALKRAPTLTTIHRQIGDLCARQGDRPRAVDAYQQLLDADPDDAAARAAVGRLAYDLGLEGAAEGDAAAAVRYLELALAADPTSPRAEQALAVLARIKGLEAEGAIRPGQGRPGRDLTARFDAVGVPWGVVVIAQGLPALRFRCSDSRAHCSPSC